MVDRGSNHDPRITPLGADGWRLEQALIRLLGLGGLGRPATQQRDVSFGGDRPGVADVLLELVEIEVLPAEMLLDVVVAPAEVLLEALVRARVEARRLEDQVRGR